MVTIRLGGDSAATPVKYVNVLEHALGYFKHQLCGDEKLEMLELFD